MACEVCKKLIPHNAEHEFYGEQHAKIYSLFTGWPYGAELTYKHPYWWDSAYSQAWQDWRISGGMGEEPKPGK